MTPKNPKKSKLYIGRMFSLRKGVIFTSPGGRAYNDGNLTALIIDEGNKTVKVQLSDRNQIVSLSKFYLHREIVDTVAENPIGQINKIIENLRLQLTRLERLRTLSPSDPAYENCYHNIKQDITQDMTKLRNAVTMIEEDDF